MAITELPFYASRPAFDYQITLEGRQFTLIYEYLDRRGSWYLSVENAEGRRITTRQRVTPGADLCRRLTNDGPAGQVTCVAPDPYRREDPVILYVSSDEPTPLFEAPRSGIVRIA